MSIEENVLRIKSEIAAAARETGREPEQIQLCAATKMNDAEAVRRAVAAGVDCCGENRVQELTAKLAEHAYDGVPVDFIGHLQTNKVRQVVGRVRLIQSVDSPRLLQAIQAEAARQGLIQDILLEVNIGKEPSKSGFMEEEVLPLLEKIGLYPNICIKGLMTIPPISQNKGDNVKFFQKISQLCVDIRKKKYDNVTVDCLSMGMSDDYADAVRCGSTMVRVGTAIFGARQYTL